MRQNSFDAIRIIAALSVMVSHAFQVTSGVVLDDPLYRLSGGQMTLGGLAVVAFFGLSGYLVMGSWERTPVPLAFARARALRVWPALIVVVLVTVLLIGPALTTSGTYWTDPQTWGYLQNLLFHQERTTQTLPGVFTTNPLPHVVNGPLWTLEFEVACYLCLLGFGALRLLTRESVAAAAIILALLAWTLRDTSPPWVFLPLAFTVGAALRAWRNVVPWTSTAALLSVLLVTAGLAFGALQFLASTVGVYALLHLGRGGALRGWGRWGDPSYGVYIWGMLIQQVIVSVGVGLTPGSNLLVSVPITLVLAYASWHVIERRALARKRSGRDAPTVLAGG